MKYRVKITDYAIEQMQEIVLYISIDETNNTVWITGIIYEKQDQLAALRRMPMI